MTGKLAVASIAAAAVGGVMAATPTAEAAVVGTFVTQVVQGVDPSNAIVQAQIEVLDDDVGVFANQLRFTLIGGNSTSVLTDILLGSYTPLGGNLNGLITSAGIGTEGSAVDYVTGSSGLSIPGFTAGSFSFSAFQPTNPQPQNGIALGGVPVGEFLTIGFNLASGVTFAALGTEITQGAIAVKFQGGCTAGEDESSCQAISIVPLPAAMPLLASGLFGLAGFGWLRRRRSTERSELVPA